MGRLEGKIAIVTGAGQGMGESHARLFVREGAKVVLTDIRDEEGRSVADSLGAAAAFVHHDVTDFRHWAEVLAFAEQRFGRVNVLVNNAGIVGRPVSTVDLALEDYETICAINQNGVFLGMKSVIPSMIDGGGGAIVNISSIAGMGAIRGSPNLAYIASKFAVRGMTKQVALDYGARNIRCNSVHPGFIQTPMLDAVPDEIEQAVATSVPLRRIGDPAEVSNLVAFLASDESSYITGMEHVIDGGLTAD